MFSKLEPKLVLASKIDYKIGWEQIMIVHRQREFPKINRKNNLSNRQNSIFHGVSTSFD